MKISGSLRSAIRKAAQEAVGQRCRVEVGFRPLGAGANSGPNALNWDDDADLDDIIELKDLTEVDENAANPGVALLDLYTYEPDKRYGSYVEGGDMITNVYLLLQGDAVILATDNPDSVHAKLREMGVKGTRGWALDEEG